MDLKNPVGSGGTSNSSEHRSPAKAAFLVIDDLCGRWVRMRGSEALYGVVRVDQDAGTADLLALSAIRRIECGVPITSLHLVDEQYSPRREELQPETA